MKTIYSACIVYCLLLCVSCRLINEVGGGYEKENGKIYWNFGLGGTNHQPVEGADYKTFQSINQYYGKDKQHVFYRTGIIEADAGSFAVFNSPEYAHDKDAVYYNGEIIPGADADSYSLYPVVGVDNSYYNVYGKDKQHIFEFDRIISDDPEHFKVINPNENIWKDDHAVHRAGIIIDSADAPSFEAVLFKERSQEFTRYSSYYKDKFIVFVEVKDKGTVVKIIPLAGADVHTFQLISENFQQPEYAKDAQHVYYEDKIIEGADAATFKLNPDGSATDKNYSYSAGRKLNQ